VEAYVRSVIQAVKVRLDHAQLRADLRAQGVTTESQLHAYARQRQIDPQYLALHVKDGRRFSEEFGTDVATAYQIAVLKSIATPTILAYLVRCAIGQEPPPEDPDVQDLVALIQAEFVEQVA
jgi:hypothetical protein